MEKGRRAGHLELRCDSENKQDGEDTLESKEYLNGFGSEEGTGKTREQRGEWSKE